MGHAPGPFGKNNDLAVRVTNVSRVHDMGGQTGFGPVPVGENGEPPVAADWEARVYALATMLRRRGVFNSDELRDAIERPPPDDSARGIDPPRVETCYAVRFRAADLWGSGDHTVTVDLWESYFDRP